MLRRDGETVLIATLMLICAVLVSLAFGVLLAYGLCLLLFRLFVAHAVAVAQRQVPSATASFQG